MTVIYFSFFKIKLHFGVFGLSVPGTPFLISFNKLNFLLVEVQSLWFQWFSAYLNHVDFLMSHVRTCFKESTVLLNVHLCCFVDLILYPTDKYMFKFNNRKIKLICWMDSKLKINTAWHRSGVFIADFDHNQHLII